MTLTPVTSSNISAIGYDAPLSELLVQFHDGALYHYAAVPAATFHAFARADSKGGYLAKHIKPRFTAFQSNKPKPKGKKALIGV